VKLQNNWEIDYNELTFENELGRGAYGTRVTDIATLNSISGIVYLGVWRLQKVQTLIALDSDILGRLPSSSCKVFH
jgi:hypothetical protein